MAEVKRVILWDIDGTLVHTAGVGAAAFATAVESLFGVPAANHGASLAGKTDPQIAREILAAGRDGAAGRRGPGSDQDRWTGPARRLSGTRGAAPAGDPARRESRPACHFFLA